MNRSLSRSSTPSNDGTQRHSPLPSAFIRAGLKLAFGFSLVLGLWGCASEPSPTAQGALVGGAVGAGAGAVVGNQFGEPGIGAAVGGATGAATGAIVGDAEERNYEEKIELQEEIIRRQQQEIDRQGREIEDLKRQKYHNDSLRRFEQ